MDFIGNSAELKGRRERKEEYYSQSLEQRYAFNNVSAVYGAILGWALAKCSETNDL